MHINHLAIEVTRRCNIQCAHCIRGYSQCLDIPLEYIDDILEGTDSIGHFCPTGGEPSLNIPAIQYFIDGCKSRGITLDQFYISTNGIDISLEFIDVCQQLYDMCIFKYRCSVQVSNDKYHLEKRKYNDELLSMLPFYSKRYKEGSDMYGTIAYEGLAEVNDISIAKRNFRSAVGQTYLNAEGYVIDGDCWSYKNQAKHIICHVKEFHKKQMVV